jgi:hypothetical protein
VRLSKHGNRKNTRLELDETCNPTGIYNAGKFLMSHFYRKQEKYRNQERDTYKEKFHKKKDKGKFSSDPTSC